MTAHLLPNEVNCERVVFAAQGAEMEPEGYWVHISRLRDEDHWVPHLSRKRNRGEKPALVMLVEALARKGTSY